MDAPFSEEQTRAQAIDLSDLPLDLRRMLSIQCREFIHFIEDREPETVLENNPRVIKFLERCYRTAA